MSRSDSAKLHVSISRAVVGVDGSPESLAALEWLAGVIEADGTIVAVGVGNDADRTRLEHEWTKGRAGRATVQCRATEGEPAEVLLAVADEVDADLVVVGVHPKLRLAPRTIGHVTADLIRNADRPVVVVDGPQRVDVPGATIVVDTASGKATDAAVRWAAGFADAHGSALELVHSRPNQPIFSPDGLLDALALYIDPDVLGEWAVQELTALADELQGATEQDLQIGWTSQLGRAGAHLVEASQMAALVVIGRNTLPGLDRVIPHVLRQVVTKAPCPVVIVPPLSPDEPTDPST